MFGVRLGCHPVHPLSLFWVLLFCPFRIILVESIPLGMTYDGQDKATFGVPLEQAWSDLISVATKHIEVASFYWTLTGEDVNVNSSSDLPVECFICFS